MRLKEEKREKLEETLNRKPERGGMSDRGEK